MTGNISRRKKEGQKTTAGEQPPSVKAFAVRLLAARKAAKLSQIELHKRSGISQPHISQLELGNLEPRLTTIMSLANALDLNPSDLLPEKDLSQQTESKQVSEESIVDPIKRLPEQWVLSESNKTDLEPKDKIPEPEEIWRLIYHNLEVKIGRRNSSLKITDMHFHSMSGKEVRFVVLDTPKMHAFNIMFAETILSEWKKWNFSVDRVTFYLPSEIEDKELLSRFGAGYTSPYKR